ncbi:MAG: isoleucine--tRNA ligase [Myxococcota bacterium]|nr:isoleucine--tRNA ligase [Myxococcota bacterium]
MPFSELPNPADLEAEVLAWWKSQNTFREGLRLAQGRPEFVFYEGPPTANGTPHNGHVLTRAIKDLIPRYKAMQGFYVHRKAGWDTHGLPVEVEVEKELDIHGREAIEAYGMEAFSRKCIESVFKYTEQWEQLTDRIGFWVNMDEAYVTYHRAYVESVWWALSRLFEKGLLYQGHKVVWWWPQGGTTLSAGEVGQGYKEVNDPSVSVRFTAQDPHAVVKAFTRGVRTAEELLAGTHPVSFLAWTTTPWTLPSNTAIAVSPKLNYLLVKLPLEDGGDELVVVAEALREKILGEGVGEVIAEAKGSELDGLRYQPIYDFAKPETGDFHKVIVGTHVTADSGTGLVHTAPAFGEDDFKVAQDNGVGLLQLIAPNGKFVEGTGFLEGLFCKDADKVIVRDLKERGVLFKHEQYRHDYPFCWRKMDDPLIQYARPAWFIKTTALNAEALENNQAVNWMPEHIKDGRFGDFLRNNVDWALSRERFWGTPLNIWVCPECNAHKAPASVAEIEALNAAAGRESGFDQSVDKDLQVHRPWIDRVTLPCGCGATMHRVPEVIDCWFDSGAMPFAQWGFPHAEGSKDIFQKRFPADFISEAVDQTRGWFYSLLMISTLLFDDETCTEYGLEPVGMPRPYKNCIVLGHVTDMDGKKESKSKGNYTSPDLVMLGQTTLNVIADEQVKAGTVGFMAAQVKSLGFTPKEQFTAVGPSGERKLSVAKAKVTKKDTVHLNPADIAALGLDGTVTLKAPFQAPGADAFRWLFYASNPPWSNTRLSLRNIREGQREFHLRLRNVHSFFSIYANIAGFDPASGDAPTERSALDRWILHELNQTTATMTAELEAYNIYEAARSLQAFVEGLSNWYVRRSRSRFWNEDPAALWTLYEVLVQVAHLSAPFVPFMAEALYRDLCGHLPESSVHHRSWPKVDEAALDAGLSENMALIRELSSLGLAARKKVGQRVRQPLRAVEVILAEPERAAALEPLLPLLTEELNVRGVHFSQRAGDFVDFQVKPNYPVLGRRLGKDMKLCAGMLAKMDGAEVRNKVLAGGLTLDLPNGPVTLGPDEVDVRVTPKGSFQAAGSAKAVVALDSELDEDLREEGLSREVISRVQGLRKQLDLGYTQRIALHVAGDDKVVAAVKRFQEHVGGETLVSEWADAPFGEPVVDDIDGLAVEISVRGL